MQTKIEGREKVLLVIIDFKRDDKRWEEDTANELAELVVACGGAVVDRIVCRIDHISATSFIGKGKVEEIAQLCSTQGINTAVFSHDLKGSQQRNLEEVIGVKTIDRTQLILDIFARRAHSQEGQMQVELAQLEYLLPRLVGKGIALSRLGGGIGTSGPGETKLEVDRRRIGQRITILKKKLTELASGRAVTRKKRQDRGIPLIALVGYTNAGKSTLLNTLTQAQQVTRDGYFTTLDPLSRQWVLPNHQKTVLSDTVGFMRDLPHHLIESFKATLQEVLDADLLLHVLDISDEHFRDHYDAVLSVLQELGAHDKLIVTVFNKIDQVKDPAFFEHLKLSTEHSVFISAKTEKNLKALLDKIMALLSAQIVDIDVTLPINRMDLINLAHKEGQVLSVKYYNDTIHLRASLPIHIVGRFQKVG